MTKQIKVGDVVKVINRGQTYSTYEKWAELHSLKNYKKHAGPSDGNEGIVEVIARHENYKDEILCGINVDGKHFIIGIQGLEFVRENKPFDLQLFQRVELRNGEKGIIASSTQEGYKGNIIVLKEGWAEGNFSSDKYSIDAQYEIVKVFDVPMFNNSLFDFKISGNLLWSETKPEVVAADLAVTEAENAVKAAQVALEAAQAARKAVK